MLILRNEVNDTGPIYTETDPTGFPVEPFNTASNLIFLFILIYWGVRVYRSPGKQPFLAFVLPVLAVGFIGGTIFHATRSHEIWLLMDWVPILVLCFAAVIYFVNKITHKWYWRLTLALLIIGLSLGVRALPIPEKVSHTIGYVITAITLLLPLFLYMRKTQWSNWRPVLWAVLCFMIALGFRFFDRRQDFLEIGTHWLWHIFGGLAVFYLLTFIYRDQKKLQTAS
ncbi:ceramidase domain-containing protein [Robertkochia aurantiaca]|uniref:ceramidase domain-containing protein n=1 Tax=Robertkochia aurantiaca TaxID=2873700 RepID=UPI001CCBFA74|nr:ceramidase domain-containing protein [Robertkochia sp. 3YJGBD-33]